MLICIGAVSCQKENFAAVEEDPAAGVTTGNSIKVRLENRQEEAQTKLTVDSSTGASSWTAGDQIAFCITNGSTTSYQTETVDVSASEIPYNIPAGYSRVNYAIYPAASKGTNFTAPTVVYPSSYNLSGKVAQTYSPMPMVAINADGILDFYHIGGLLRLDITEADAATSKIIVSFSDIANVCGTYTVSGAGTDDVSVSLLSGDGNTLTFTGVSVSSGETWVNIPLPKGTPLTTITVKTFNSSSEELQSVDKRIAWASVGRTKAKQFVIDMSASGDGALSGEFSVSSTTKVRFAQGNLQAVIGTGISNYIATASEWKFAENQYDFIGNAAGNTSLAVGTIVDLFGWVGTSASYDSYGLCTNTSYNNAYYGTSASDAIKTDWGSIPGVVSSYGDGWFTLTSTQWNYLFTQRANASSLYGQCQISTANGTVTGMLILPDNWTKPSNCTVTPGTGAFDRITYSATASSGASNAWCDMEAAGAVFLPAAGYRSGVSVGNVGSYGYYWSSSVYYGNYAYSVYFYSGYLNPQYYYRRCDGFSVRLVR